METNKFEWVEFYEEFASALLGYKDNRLELIRKVKEAFINGGIKLPTLEKDNNIVDIDPFTVFGLFNKSGMRLDNRIAILNEIANVFNIKSQVPENFNSVPLLNGQNAAFYYFIDNRDVNDIADLWKLFELALLYANNSSIENQEKLKKSFDCVMNKKGIGNSKLTMGLYWIASDVYINLDNCNIEYIYNKGKLPQTFVSTLPKISSKISANEYFDIIEKFTRFFNDNNLKINNYRDLSETAWHSTKEEKITISVNESTNYWWYTPGEEGSKWEDFYNEGVMRINEKEYSDLNLYHSEEELKGAVVKNTESENPINIFNKLLNIKKVVKKGDIIFAKKKSHDILGVGVVSSNYEFDDTDNLDYPHKRKVKWLVRREFTSEHKISNSSLEKINPKKYNGPELLLKFNIPTSNLPIEVEDKTMEYSKNKFFEDVYMGEEDYDTLVGLIKRKKNVILQGVPGVGKTFVAKRLAYSIMGVKDESRVAMIQFHQSYSYEDLIEGYRPTEAGFELHEGSLYSFCNKAANDLDNDYFFIIDEINRGNISKIFGELFMLIENDKRGESLKLLYSDKNFCVPSNLYIIGMMNTADRSLAMLDYALRRRFAFFEMKPAFTSSGFIDYQNNLNSNSLNKLIDCIQNLNNEIKNDESLGAGFCIGHSYFCDLDLTENKVLSNIIEYEIIPLLKEYWFDEVDKVATWSEKLRGSIK